VEKRPGSGGGGKTSGRAAKKKIYYRRWGGKAKKRSQKTSIGPKKRRKIKEGKKGATMGKRRKTRPRRKESKPAKKKKDGHPLKGGKKQTNWEVVGVKKKEGQFSIGQRPIKKPRKEIRGGIKSDAVTPRKVFHRQNGRQPGGGKTEGTKRNHSPTGSNWGKGESTWQKGGVHGFKKHEKNNENSLSLGGG